MESKRSWKVALTAAMVKEQLCFARISVIGDTGKIVNFARNAEQKRYVIFDSHRDAPMGFGVAVNRLIEQRFEGDMSLSYVYDTAHRLTTIIHSSGRSLGLEYNGAREDAKIAVVRSAGAALASQVCLTMLQELWGGTSMFRRMNRM